MRRTRPHFSRRSRSCRLLAQAFIPSSTVVEDRHPRANLNIAHSSSRASCVEGLTRAHLWLDTKATASVYLCISSIRIRIYMYVYICIHRVGSKPSRGGNARGWCVIARVRDDIGTCVHDPCLADSQSRLRLNNRVERERGGERERERKEKEKEERKEGSVFVR